MFTNFWKKWKINLPQIKTKFLFLVKFVNLNTFLYLIFWYVILDFLLNDAMSNIFICSFLINIFSWINTLNLSVFLVFYFLISLNTIILNFFKIKININYVYNYNNFLLIFFFYIYNLISFRINLIYLLNWIVTFIKFNYLKLSKVSYFFNILLKKISVVSWYTIFKRHSIFGFYRISRQRWVELKSEELNFLKY